MNYSDLAQTVTTQLVQQVEAGPAGTWSMPWHRAPHVLDVRNGATGNPYRGANVIALASTSIDRDYPTSIYATYRQWSDLGAQIRRGEKAAQVIRWVTPKNKSQPADADGAESSGGRRLVPVVFSVFNAAQVDGYQPDTAETLLAYVSDLPAESDMSSVAPEHILNCGGRTVEVIGPKLVDEACAVYEEIACGPD